jgi:hypothetical protein
MLAVAEKSGDGDGVSVGVEEGVYVDVGMIVPVAVNVLVGVGERKNACIAGLSTN